MGNQPKSKGKRRIPLTIGRGDFPCSLKLHMVRRKGLRKKGGLVREGEAERDRKVGIGNRRRRK